MMRKNTMMIMIMKLSMMVMITISMMMIVMITMRMMMMTMLELTRQGELGDLWGWRSLSPGQEEYLVQVRSPSDLLPYVMKDLALATEMKHVAVLYDDTFCKNY